MEKFFKNFVFVGWTLVMGISAVGIVRDLTGWIRAKGLFRPDTLNQIELLGSLAAMALVGALVGHYAFGSKSLVSKESR